MLDRVVTIQVKPEKLEECLAIFKKVNVSSVAVRQGFDHGHWWVDRTSGEATSWSWPSGKTKPTRKRVWSTYPHLVEGMSHVLASGEIYQDTFELIQGQHRIERSEEASPT